MFSFLPQITMSGGASLSLSAGAISTLTVELIKWVTRRFVVKNSEFDFAPIFYQLSIPFFTAFWGLILYLTGLEQSSEYTWGILLEWLLAIVVSLSTYVLAIKPFKDYAKGYKKIAG